MYWHRDKAMAVLDAGPEVTLTEVTLQMLHSKQVCANAFCVRSLPVYETRHEDTQKLYPLCMSVQAYDRLGL